MGSSVLLVFIIPIMLVDWVCSLFGVDFNSLWDTLVSAETLDSVFGAIADVLKPIVEIFSGII